MLIVPEVTAYVPVYAVLTVVVFIFNCRYFVNIETGKSQWEMPDDYRKSPSMPAPSRPILIAYLCASCTSGEQSNKDVNRSEQCEYQQRGMRGLIVIGVDKFAA
jgi:hypothetical protein